MTEQFDAPATYQAIIIGAGAAGLFCALTAARRGIKTAVLDRQNKTGRKLNLAGGGMGNVSNLSMGPEYYTGQDILAIAPLLRAFPAEQVLDLLAEFGIPWEEREFGQIFCLRPVSHLTRCLVQACHDLGVDFYLGGEVRLPPPPRPPQTSAAGRMFSVTAGRAELQAKALVLATGSPACPQSGASDFGGKAAARLGHQVIPFRPVLVPFRMEPDWPLHGLAGISLPVRIQVHSASGRVTDDPNGIRSLIFTHQGISGPAVLVASCFWRIGDTLSIDFMPRVSLVSLLHQPQNGKLLLKNLLARHLPDRLVLRLLPPELAERKSAELSKQARAHLGGLVHGHKAIPQASPGLAKAEAAAGGVVLRQLSDSLESKLWPGLFFCGEVLDVTGILGGYNIHWALASGWRVGNSL